MKKKKRVNKKRVFILGGCIFLCLSIIMIISLVIKETKLNEERIKDNTEKERIFLTLDINPSIELELDKEDNILDIIPINDDAKKMIQSTRFIGKKLKESLEKLIDKIIDNKYTYNDNIDILLFGENKDLRIVKDDLENIIKDKNYKPNIIIFNGKISDSAKELAKKHNISVARAAYLEEILKSNSNLTIDKIINKSISEIKEMKDTGKYCLDDKVLHDGSCYKEKDRVPALDGDTCPQEEYEYIVDIKLVGKECIIYEVTEATSN